MTEWGLQPNKIQLIIYAADGDFEVTLTITFPVPNGEDTASTTQTVSVSAGTMAMDGVQEHQAISLHLLQIQLMDDTGELRLRVG